MKYVIDKGFLKLFVFFISGFVFSAYSENPESLVEGPDKVDFGKYPANEKKEAAFTIHNKNKIPLIIKNIRKTCGCASVSVSKMEMQPGEKSVIKLFVEPESIAGAYSKNVYIETDNPWEKFISLSFSGEAVFPFTVKPQDRINAGRISSGRPFAQEFMIQPSGENYTLGGAVVISDIKASCELKKEDGGIYRARVSLDTENHMGAFRATVKIPIAGLSAWKPLEITITGKVGFELTAFPSKIRKYRSDEQGNMEAFFQLKLLGTESINKDVFEIMKPENVELFLEEEKGNAINCKIKIRDTSASVFPLEIHISSRETSPLTIVLEKPQGAEVK